jgi:hypothetical protein
VTTDPAADLMGEAARSTLLAVYDSRLRGEAEANGASRWDTDGPLIRAVFDGGFGFVSYRSLAGLDGASLDALIRRTVDHFAQASDVTEFEWKTRGHDAPADLGGRLTAQGLVAGTPETVMLGEVTGLIADVPLPRAISLRRVGYLDAGAAAAPAAVRDDVDRVLHMQETVFGTGARQSATELVQRIMSPDEGAELWVAEGPAAPEADPSVSVVVCAGRLEVVPGTGIAGIWGGATLQAWRGRGIYRALTAARARSAMRRGVQYIQSDCTEKSRPILQRAGLVAVTTTTPYLWTRGND